MGGFGLGQFGGEAVRMTEVVMPGIGGFRQKRRGVPLAEKPGRIIEDGQFAPAVGPELIAGEVACQGGLKFLFDVGIFIGGFRSELVKKRLDGRQQVFPILR